MSARQAVRHLVEHGHKRIACLSGLSGSLSNDDRIRGYRLALEEADISFDEQLVLGYAFSEQSGYESVHQLLAKKTDVTAVFATSSLCALGALRAVAEAGKEVPDDLSIVTFDDIPGAEFMRTPLTAVVQPVLDLGRKAAEILFAQIKNEKSLDLSPVLLPTELVVRQSVKSLR